MKVDFYEKVLLKVFKLSEDWEEFKLKSSGVLECAVEDNTITSDDMNRLTMVRDVYLNSF